MSVRATAGHLLCQSHVHILYMQREALGPFISHPQRPHYSAGWGLHKFYRQEHEPMMCNWSYVRKSAAFSVCYCLSHIQLLQCNWKLCLGCVSGRISSLEKTVLTLIFGGKRKKSSLNIIWNQGEYGGEGEEKREECWPVFTPHPLSTVAHGGWC